MAVLPEPPVCAVAHWFTIYSLPPNASYELFDLDERWDLGNKEPWDLIYARFMAGSIASWRTFFRRS